MTEETPQNQLSVKTEIVKVPIPFFATIPANTGITLVSNPISVHFVIKEIEAHFRDDSANNVLVYFLNSNNRNDSGNTLPADTRLVSSLSPTPYLCGEGEIITLPMNYTPEANYQYIKVFFQNNNAYAITCLAVVVIDGYLKIPATENDIVPITEEQKEQAGIYQSEILGRTKAILDLTTDVMKGTPPLLTGTLFNLKTQQDTTQKGQVQIWKELTEISKVIPPDMPLLDRVNSGRDWIDRVVEASYTVSTSSSLVNMITGAFGGSVWNYEQWLNQVFGLTDKVHEAYSMGIDIALLKPIQYLWNQAYKPELPSIGDLTKFWLSGTMTNEEVVETGALLGFNSEWMGKFIASMQVFPSSGDLTELYKRGFIDRITFTALMQRNGYREPYISDLLNLAQEFIPDTVLIQARIKGVISEPQYNTFMAINGFDQTKAELIYNSHYALPDINTIIRSARRGKITEAELSQYFRYADLDPRFDETLWKPLMEEIPATNELINQRVKEVITQETFNNAMKYYGFAPEWSQRIWDAHFNPATWTDFLTAMRRKLTVTIPHAEGSPTQHTFGLDEGKDLEVIRELSLLVDYDPRYQSFFDTRIYNDPTPRMAQWGFESGVLDEEGVRNIVHRYGFTPDTEKWYGDMLLHFRDRAWNNRYLTQLMSNYVNDALTYEELEQKVLEATHSITIAETMKKIGDLRKDLQAKAQASGTEKAISTSELKQMYFYKIKSPEEFRTDMQLRGYSDKDITDIINLFNIQYEQIVSGGRKEGLTVAELFDAYRYEEIDEQELKTNLLLRGMTELDANTLIASKKKKWNIGG